MAASGAALRPQVNHVVRGFDELRVVFDDQQGMPLLHQFPKHGQQNFNVCKVKPRSRLVQNQHLGAVRAGTYLVQQDFSQLQALVFPAGKGIQRLPQGQVPQPYALKHAQFGSDAGSFGPFFRAEAFQRSRYRHAEHVRNIPAVTVHAQHFAPVPGTVAQRTLNENVGKKLHFHFLTPHAHAARTPAVPTVEREKTGLQATRAGRLRFCEEGAYFFKNSGINGRGGARGADDGALVHHHHLIQMFPALDGLDAGRFFLTYGSFLHQRVQVKNIVGQGAFPGPADACQASKDAQGHFHVQFAQVMARSAGYGQKPARLAPLFGHRDASPAGKKSPRQGFLNFSNPGRHPGINQPSPFPSGTGSHIHQAVRGTHDRFLMLHHHQGVPALFKPVHGGNQTGRIAGMEPNGRFIQHKQRIRQGSAQAGRQAHAFNFPSGQGPRGAVGRQVAQSHFIQIFQAAPEFRHGMFQAGVFIRPRRHVPIHPGQQFIHGHTGKFRHAFAAHLELKGFRPQAQTVAGGAFLICAETAQVHPHVHLMRAAFQIFEKSRNAVPQPLFIHFIRVIAVAVQQPVPLPLLQILPRHIQTDFAGVFAPAAHQVPLAFGKYFSVPLKNMDGPVLNAEFRLDAPVVVNRDDAPVAAAFRARPQRGIKRKQARPRFHQRMPVSAEFQSGQPDAVHTGNHMGHAAAQAHGRFQRFQPAFPLVFRQPHAVLNHQQRFSFLQRPILIFQPEDLSMRKSAQIPLCHQIPFQRGKIHGFGPRHLQANHHFRSGREFRMQLFINGTWRFRLDFPPCFRVNAHGQTGENKLPVIIQPRHGPHRGAGCPDGVALMQGDGRKNILYGVHIRLVHAVHELAHVRGKGFHITPLAFRIQRVHGQTCFPRSGRTRHHRQPPQGNVHIHILQIMLTGAADADAPILTMTHGERISSIWNHSKRSACHESGFPEESGQVQPAYYVIISTNGGPCLHFFRQPLVFFDS